MNWRTYLSKYFNELFAEVHEFLDLSIRRFSLWIPTEITVYYLIDLEVAHLKSTEPVTDSQLEMNVFLLFSNKSKMLEAISSKSTGHGLKCIKSNFSNINLLQQGEVI